MDNHDRLVEYFMERTDKDLAEIKSKLEKLTSFRLIVIGGSLTISVICSTLISAAAIYFGTK